MSLKWGDSGTCFFYNWLSSVKYYSKKLRYFVCFLYYVPGLWIPGSTLWIVSFKHQMLSPYVKSENCHLKLAFSAKIIQTFLKWLAPVSSGVFRLRIGKLKPGLMPGTAVRQIQRYMHTIHNNIHKHKYTNTITQIQLHKWK